MIEDILAGAFEKYPLMQPQDAVKLIYQGEFGPGHLLNDEQKARKYLSQEMKQVTPDPKAPLYESIGGGLCRLDLAAAAARGIPEETVFSLFADAARTTHGDKKRFEKKLNELELMAQEGDTPFGYAELCMFLIPYREKDCPAMHHSAAYNAAYHPAYRVVAQKKLKDALQSLREAAGQAETRA